MTRRSLPFLLMVGSLLLGITARAQPAMAQNVGVAHPIALGVFLPSAPGDASAIDSFKQQTGARPAVIMWYQAWGGQQPAFDPKEADAVVARGATPMITWEPWVPGAGTSQPAYALATIASGSWDGYLHRWAKATAAWGKRLYLRFGHEMNGNWYPWCAGVNGNTASDYVAAWRHIVSLFRQDGASNVRFVWSPNVAYPGSTPLAGLYPGDDYVDWLALDGYNWGQPWQTVTQIFSSSYADITALSTRPLMIAETASSDAGGDKATWITQGLLHDLPASMPRVRALIWFDQNKDGTNWAVTSSAGSLAAFRQVASSALYRGSLH